MVSTKITNTKYIPNPNKPGFHSFDRFYTYAEVFQQIESFLKGTPSLSSECSAYGLAEWCSERSKTIRDREVKGGSLESLVRFGSNEGVIIDVMHLNPEDQVNSHKVIASLKYLGGSDNEIWQISQAITKAIYEGGYA